MRLGLLADIHEHNDHLRHALAVFRREHVDQVIVLGDVCGMMEESLVDTCRLLGDAGAIGVWGNHDFALCRPDEATREVYPPSVLDFMTALRPTLEVHECFFTHVEPWLDAESLEDLWYFDGPPDTPEKAARSFAAVPHRTMFIGHFHRWLIARANAILPWRGGEPTCLDTGARHLVVVGAVCEGRFGIFDTASAELIPFSTGTFEDQQ